MSEQGGDPACWADRVCEQCGRLIEHEPHVCGLRSPIVVTGPPGAGKSVVGRALAERFSRSVLVAGDEFFAFLARGRIDPWLPESQRQNEIVTRAAGSSTGAYVRGGYATIYDGVIGPWFLPTFATATGLYSLEYVLLLPSEERCVENVQTRTGHAFSDDDATRKMHLEFAKATIDERHVLRDPPDGVDAVVDVILAGVADGRFRYEVSSAAALP